MESIEMPEELDDQVLVLAQIVHLFVDENPNVKGRVEVMIQDLLRQGALTTFDKKKLGVLCEIAPQ